MVYSLDGVALNQPIAQVVHRLGTPNDHYNLQYKWRLRDGSSIIVAVDRHNNVDVIDEQAGRTKRAISVPGVGPGQATLGETGHVNFLLGGPHDEMLACGLAFTAYCEAAGLPANVAVIAYYGIDNRMADWALSEVILGRRDVLVQLGEVRKLGEDAIFANGRENSVNVLRIRFADGGKMSATLVKYGRQEGRTDLVSQAVPIDISYDRGFWTVKLLGHTCPAGVWNTQLGTLLSIKCDGRFSWLSDDYVAADEGAVQNLLNSLKRAWVP